MTADQQHMMRVAGFHLRHRRLTPTFFVVLHWLARSSKEVVKQAELAWRSGVTVRTVQRALAAAHKLGLLTWVRRSVPGMGRMVANRYLLNSNLSITYQSIKSSDILSRCFGAFGAGAALAARARPVTAEEMARRRARCGGSSGRSV